MIPKLRGREVARRATGLTGAASVGPIHSYKVEKVWNVLPLRDAITNVQQCTTLRHSFREAPLLEIIEMSKLQTPSFGRSRIPVRAGPNYGNRL